MKIISKSKIRVTNSKNRIINFKKVTILGVGLLGASFALAMKKYKLCVEVMGFGRREENLLKAKKRGIIDSFDLDPVKVCHGADLIIFATPVGSFIDITRRIVSSLKKGSIVTDVGSVKGRLVRDMEALMPEGVYFIGGHPIAGSDRSGIETASADIFFGAKCIITPTERTDRDALEKIIRLWETFGSVVKTIDPDEHDRVYASVSHLPHLLAYAIVNTVADIDRSFLKFSGQGFLDTTRIASSSPELWRDICLLNRDNLLESLEVFKNSLERLSGYLRTNDSESLEREFEKARALRESLGKD
ncbi:MAG: prephenate dehydrogenase/arogenate dehydrogenase family protein [Nitrospirota bacterium]